MISENAPRKSRGRGIIEQILANSMPKRKRSHRPGEDVDPAREAELKRGQIEKKLVHSKKVLNRALKTAKGFERQKLSKRIKLATTQHDGREAGRLQKELEVLKVRVKIPLEQCLR